jgi:hypothetical protein
MRDINVDQFDDGTRWKQNWHTKTRLLLQRRQTHLDTSASKKIIWEQHRFKKL